MKRILKLVNFEVYKEVHFYTFEDMDTDENLTHAFIDRFKNPEEELQPSYVQILLGIEKMGETGIDIELLRDEKVNEDYEGVYALPFNADHIPQDAKGLPSLRLYGIRKSDSVYILISGDIKKEIKVEDCENCRIHHRFANNIFSKLRILERSTEIILDDKLYKRKDGQDIIIEANYGN